MISKELKDVLARINKNHGDGTVMSLEDSPVPTEVISTGSFGLDVALGVGGLPKGRIIELFGPESSGKTTIAIHVIAEAQKKKNVVAFIDAEHAFDREYAKNLGVNVKELIFNQPNSGEEALQIAEELISSGEIGVVVIDSVAALTPKAEIEGEMGDTKMGLQARLMGQALRKLVATTSKNNVLLIFINQTREKIGIVYGSPITTPGGNALKFYASVRLDVSKSLSKVGDEIVGNKTRVKVVKSKVAPPFKIAEFDILFGEGIDKVGEILDAAVGYDIIKQGGSWLTYGDTKVQGRDKFRHLMKDNPDFLKEIEIKVKQKLNEEA